MPCTEASPSGSGWSALVGLASSGAELGLPATHELLFPSELVHHHSLETFVGLPHHVNLVQPAFRVGQIILQHLGKVVQ